MSDGGYPFLDVQNVVKKFGGLVANNKVSLQVGQGEIRGLIGPNGSGKTTLINVITGIYEPDEGNIFYAGKRIDGLRPDVVASLGIMRTFQVARVFRDMTVMENMLIPAFCQGQSRKEAVSRAPSAGPKSCWILPCLRACRIPRPRASPAARTCCCKSYGDS